MLFACGTVFSFLPVLVCGVITSMFFDVFVACGTGICILSSSMIQVFDCFGLWSLSALADEDTCEAWDAGVFRDWSLGFLRFICPETGLF